MQKLRGRTCFRGVSKWVRVDWSAVQGSYSPRWHLAAHRRLLAVGAGVILTVIMERRPTPTMRLQPTPTTHLQYIMGLRSTTYLLQSITHRQSTAMRLPSTAIPTTDLFRRLLRCDTELRCRPLLRRAKRLCLIRLLRGATRLCQRCLLRWSGRPSGPRRLAAVVDVGVLELRIGRQRKRLVIDKKVFARNGFRPQRGRLLAPRPPSPPKRLRAQPGRRTARQCRTRSCRR